MLVAVHAHPVAAVTVTVAVRPAARAFAEAGEIVGAQGAPACVTVKLLPPMVRTADLDVVAGFAVTLYPTEPLPVPLAPAVIEIQVAVSVDVHAHPAAAVTATEPVLAEKATLADVAAIVGAHGAPAWETVNVLAPIVTVPVRALVEGLALTE